MKRNIKSNLIKLGLCIIIGVFLGVKLLIFGSFIKLLFLIALCLVVGRIMART
ncbi:hypothetical protein [Anaeromicropila herbilytica]|uniref:hypothetical protein n=1 Tax=Anaeromicropila herbilytica TaxID=2785025 RepID=UPI00232A445D|nr:hypothetical protein [Anaeromicropila herbilytica]